MTVGIKRQSLSVVPILYEGYNERLRSMDGVGGNIQIRIKREAVRFLSDLCPKTTASRLFERDRVKFVEQGEVIPHVRDTEAFDPD